MTYGDALHRAVARVNDAAGVVVGPDDIMREIDNRNATEADHVAADRLLGVRRSHSRMEGLPGADKCHHILAGSGIPVVDTNGGYSREYSRTPYRHHAFTKRDDNPANVYCVCMNTDKGHNGLHVRCDI